VPMWPGLCTRNEFDVRRSTATLSKQGKHWGRRGSIQRAAKERGWSSMGRRPQSFRPAWHVWWRVPGGRGTE
jgi:hypothetical protein